GLAGLERVEDDGRAQKYARIDGIEVTQDLADLLDPAIGALYARDVVQIVDRARYIEIHSQSDGIRLECRGNQAADNGWIEQMVPHAQQEGTVQIGLGLVH